MTEAEDLFRELRGGDEPIVVGGYQYPLLVIPIAMNRGDAIAWQVPGYAHRAPQVGFPLHVRAAMSNEYLPVIVASLLVTYLYGAPATPIVRFDDRFFTGPARDVTTLYIAFNRRARWLTNDGSVGFGAMRLEAPQVTFFVDPYKHLHLLGNSPAMIGLLEKYGLQRNDRLRFLSDTPCARGSSARELRDDMIHELELVACDPPWFLT